MYAVTNGRLDQCLYEPSFNHDIPLQHSSSPFISDNVKPSLVIIPSTRFSSSVKKTNSEICKDLYVSLLILRQPSDIVISLIYRTFIRRFTINDGARGATGDVSS